MNRIYQWLTGLLPPPLANFLMAIFYALVIFTIVAFIDKPGADFIYWDQ